MNSSDIEALKFAIQSAWPGRPHERVREYIDTFTDRVRIGRRIRAKVKGSHGIYTVSIEVKDNGLSSACSCYIGKHGGCHHCKALGLTFLKDSKCFKGIETTKRDDIKGFADVSKYLQSTTLDDLLGQLKKNGISQKDFAEGIGMNPRQLTSIKSSELRHHYYNELGATKLACLWVLEHLKDLKGSNSEKQKRR